MPKMSSVKTIVTPRAKRAKKDANAPKRNLSAYFLFCGEERPKLRATDPTVSITEIAKELGRRWAELDQVTKAKFKALAVKEKERYEREKAEYESGQAANAGGQIDQPAAVRKPVAMPIGRPKEEVEPELEEKED